ncbi:MAG TPA: hypothetical protein VLT87_27600 [Thermoanaerobaculia bacterium]|nr:hypothetical protein [Thermoanaerobaculia bacterium]
MDVQINQLQSRVTSMDSDSLLDPRIVERLVRLVLRRVRDEREHGERVDGERRVTNASAPEEPVP